MCIAHGFEFRFHRDQTSLQCPTLLCSERHLGDLDQLLGVLLLGGGSAILAFARISVKGAAPFMVECLYFLADSLGITHALEENIGPFLIFALHHCKQGFARMVVYEDA